MKRYLCNYLFFFIYLFLLSVMSGCGKDSNTIDEPEEPLQLSLYKYDDPVIPAGDSIILFRTLDVAEAQKAINGKWEIFYGGGGIEGPTEITDVSVEYIGVDTKHVTRKGEIKDYIITRWRQTENGTELSFVQDNYVEILRYIYHDTLHTVTASITSHHPIAIGLAARVKD